MRKTLCNICHKPVKLEFSKIVLAKYTVAYFYCKKCDYLQTEKPYWLKEAYQAAINQEDTGLVSRNFGLAKVVSVLVVGFFNKGAKYLDYAGGYGLFTRLMRDIGLNYYTEDPYCENLLARGFESQVSDKKYELITAFEVLEHLDNPIKTLAKVFARSDNILFTTELMPTAAVRSGWQYLGLEHGQHVSFYSQKALQKIAQEYGYLLYSDGSMIHLFTKIPRNKYQFLFMIKLRIILFPFAKLHFKSKTMSDHLANKRK